jgi:RimJ/RimL family protein N-acetyltransferase
LEKENLQLRTVEESDLRFLFKLLKERNPNANISHKKMPAFSEHIQFVKSKPYSYWYVIQISHKKIGTIYLSKNNEIGIFLKKDHHNKGIASKALKLLITKHPKKRFLANINPKNKSSEKFFKNNNFKLIQHTYELDNNLLD